MADVELGAKYEAYWDQADSSGSPRRLPPTGGWGRYSTSALPDRLAIVDVVVEDENVFRH